MNPQPAISLDRLARFQRLTLIVAIVALAAALITGWMRPEAVAAAYRLAAFGCFAPAVGSLMFVLIYRMTGGQWAPDLLPYLRAGLTLAPWIWLLALPLLAFPQHGLAHLTEPAASARYYDSVSLRTARGALYAVVLFLISAGARRALRAQAAGDHTAWRWIGPAGLITLVLMLHLLIDDWVAELDPGWHSTAFPLVWMVGQALAGLSLAVGVAVLGGADPGATGAARRSLGIDWGNLLLAAVIMWWYVAFAQFLIIWAGNLPQEISWFLRRAHGGWLAVVVALAVFHFAVPFLFLLSRRFKRFPGGLAAVAGLLLCGQLAYVTWTILPAFTSSSRAGIALGLAALVGALGVFLNRYVAAARRLLVFPS